MAMELSEVPDFLSAPFRYYETRELASPPDIPLLRWSPSLTDHAGFFLSDETWYVVKGSDLGVPAQNIAPDARVFIVTHPHSETDDGSLPGLNAYPNAAPMRTNLVASDFGITQFWALDATQRREFEVVIYGFRDRFGSNSRREDYEAFLAQVGARYKRYLWEILDEEKLRLLFLGEQVPV